MYAVIRRYRAAQLGAIQQTTREAQARFLPIVSQIKGFVSYTIINAGPTEAVTVSLFESREGADESVRQAAAWVKQNPDVSRLLTDAPEIIAGDVTLHHSTSASP